MCRSSSPDDNSEFGTLGEISEQLALQVTRFRRKRYANKYIDTQKHIKTAIRINAIGLLFRISTRLTFHPLWRGILISRTVFSGSNLVSRIKFSIGLSLCWKKFWIENSLSFEFWYRPGVFCTLYVLSELLRRPCMSVCMPRRREQKVQTRTLWIFKYIRGTRSRVLPARVCVKRRYMLMNILSFCLRSLK